MSWSGFKKAVNRAGAHVIMKTSKNTESSSDPEFDDKEMKFKKFESLTQELDSELGRFKDGFVDFIDTQLQLVKALDSFYGDYSFELHCDKIVDADSTTNDSESTESRNENSIENRLNLRDGISLDYLKRLHEIKTSVLPQLMNPMEITVIQPIKELNEYNDEIHKLIKKRGRKKFDYDVLKSKVEKLQNDYDHLELTIREDGTDTKNQLQKQSEKLEKLKREFSLVSSVYLDINGRLKNEIDQYISLRFSLLDPSFESFIKIQLKLYNDMYEKLQFHNDIDASSREEYVSGRIDQRLDDILEKMKSLDIHCL